MAVLLKNGAIFLHIPKTAGSWVTQVLAELDLVAARRVGHKHITLDYLLRLGRERQWRRALPWRSADVPPEAATAYIFTFVREPLSWYESWFSYMSRPDRAWRAWGERENGAGERWHPCAPLNGLGDEDFDRFVRRVVDRRPGWVSELYSWYTGTGVARVGRQERLADDLIAILRELGERPDPNLIRRRAGTRVNDSARATGRPKWDPELRAEVARLEAAARRRFGYEGGKGAVTEP
jgi:hypothetical protein